MKPNDIDGASPSAFGKQRYITGKDYMDTKDIPGTKPRYLEVEEKRRELAKNAVSIRKQRGDSILEVKDINNDGNRLRNLYKR